MLYSVCFWFVLVKLLENDKNKQVITIHNSKIESISALKKELKTAEKIFQTAYQSGMVPKTECQRWLWEHILDLEEELHHLFIDLRNFSRHGKERIRLFQALEEAVTKTEGLCQKNLLSVLRKYNEKVPFCEEDFDFLRPALKGHLLLQIKEAWEIEDARSMSQGIMGLSALGGWDFEGITQEISLTDQLLNQDPAGIYAKMEPATKRHYRHAAGRIARYSGVSESQAVQEILEWAEKGETASQRHVGYYLMNHDPLEKQAQRRHFLYLLLSALFPCVFAVILSLLCGRIWVGFLSLLPLGQLTQMILRPILSWKILPRHLPRMELPPEKDQPVTVLALVSLLPDLEGLGAIRNKLERLYHANRGSNMLYCFLADYPEARKPWFPQDNQRLEAVRGMIEALNTQYENQFLLAVRRRVWCKTQDKYCGWERERGAITELIRFARGGETTIHCFVGNREYLCGARYLLAFNKDTELGFDSAQRLLTAALHPLNAPVLENGQVQKGYGIFCPVTSPVAGRTLFSKLTADALSADRKNTFLWNLSGQARFKGIGLIDMTVYDTEITRRIPEETVLSSNLLENAFLRAAMVDGATATEAVPPNAFVWFAKQHRQLRGIWQNISFFKNHFLSRWGKWSLLEALREALLWPALFICVIMGAFSSGISSFIMLALVLLTLGMPFFIPKPLALRQMGWAFVSLGHKAVLSFDAFFRSLWRLKRQRNLLEQETPAYSGGEKSDFSTAVSKSKLSLFLGGILLFAPVWTGKLFGICFLLFPVAASATASPQPEEKILPTRSQREQILNWGIQMLGYYERYAGKKDHWLPPDQVQDSPIDRIMRRTSPGNIGMMLLSYLAARDMGFIDSTALNARLTRTFDTLDKLEKYKGNLYNWYATGSLEVLAPRFIPFADNGNLFCTLTVLREGIREYSAEEPKLHKIGERIDQYLSEGDLGIFYDASRNLFSVGVDHEGRQIKAHYDYFMNETKAASYYAIARRQVPFEHWKAMAREGNVWKGHSGPVSWTGGMFEFFMPHLWLPAPDQTLLAQGLSYALHCQKNWNPQKPWGVSESSYLSFDDDLNYQYQAHGIPPLAAKQQSPSVISPYSSFLALPWDIEGALSNLAHLEGMGASGQYGFYEGIDMASEHEGVVRSYMAQHIGMSIASCANALFDGVLQKRFMRDPMMGAAKALLEEKPLVFHTAYQGSLSEEKTAVLQSVVVSQHENPNVQSPACTILSNESLTHFFTDAGISTLCWGDVDVIRYTNDLLANPQGIFLIAQTEKETLSAASTPFYPEGKHTCIFNKDEVIYQGKGKHFILNQHFQLEKGLPAERISIILKNQEPEPLTGNFLFYFEPVLSQRAKYKTAPEFSKLFLTGGRDASTSTLIFSRRCPGCKESIWLCAGFDRPMEYHFTLKREEAAPYPEGFSRLFRPESIKMEGGTTAPDGCCAIRFPMAVPQKGKLKITFWLCCGKSREEAVNNLLTARRGKSHPAPAPLANDSITARLGSRLLPRLLYEMPFSIPRREALLENNRTKEALWELGLSGDRPIVLYEWENLPDRAVLDAYLQFWQMMRRYRLEFDFCVANLSDTIPLPKGVYRFQHIEPDLLQALKAAAKAIVSHQESLTLPQGTYHPAEIFPVEPKPVQLQNGFSVVGGVFGEGGFAVERVTPLPFSHVLANEKFGCLLQDAGLGFTWFENPQACCLTSGETDLSCGYNGERMLLSVGNRIYDICKGAKTFFSPELARYEGKAGEIDTRLEIRIDPTAAIQYLDVILENTGEKEEELVCAYGLEPVLGNHRNEASYIRFEQYHGNLLVHNPWQKESPCWMALRVSGEHPTYMVERAAFYSGDWQAQPLQSSHDPIAVLLVRKHLPPKGRETIRFLLAAAGSREEALALTEPQPLSKKEWKLRVNTPNQPLNDFLLFAFHQLRIGRRFGQMDFSMPMGSYGFRERLQDAGACLWVDPALTKAEILNCCAAQFPEGDVLHWWKELPGGRKGMRTRCSDDMLWLPVTVCDYIDATGEKALLDFSVPYCQGEALEEGEQNRYQRVESGKQTGTVMEHCTRALDYAWRLGEHGLPLIGSGDWNDGFSQIGTAGQGESVWLAMFYAMAADRFAEIASPPYAHQCKERAAALRRAVDASCWDGKWYLRAFYDNGTPIGGRQCSEYRIGLLPQAFSALCNMPDTTRIKSALDEVMTRLVDFRHGIIKLFTPPFDAGSNDPGDIKTYPPGIRENGGQCTQAALWLAIALLKQDRVEEGWALLDMINPAARCTVADLALEMKTEPYLLMGDLSADSGCYGHGGRTISTGAAGWFCRAVLETLLGLHFYQGKLFISPKVPKKWNHFSLKITLRGTELEISACRKGEQVLWMDGMPVRSIPLDGKKHKVIIEY